LYFFSLLSSYTSFRKKKNLPSGFLVKNVQLGPTLAKTKTGDQNQPAPNVSLQKGAFGCRWKT